MKIIIGVCVSVIILGIILTIVLFYLKHMKEKQELSSNPNSNGFNPHSKESSHELSGVIVITSNSRNSPKKDDNNLSHECIKEASSKIYNAKSEFGKNSEKNFKSVFTEEDQDNTIESIQDAAPKIIDFRSRPVSGNPALTARITGTISGQNEEKRNLSFDTIEVTNIKLNNFVKESSMLYIINNNY